MAYILLFLNLHININTCSMISKKCFHVNKFLYLFFSYIYVRIWYYIGSILVLVLSGCYHKIPQTGWLINNTDVFLTLMEGESLKSGGWLGLLRAFFQLHTLCCNFPLGKELGSSVEYLFKRTLIPCLRTSSLWPNKLPKAPSTGNTTFKC